MRTISRCQAVEGVRAGAKRSCLASMVLLTATTLLVLPFVVRASANKENVPIKKVFSGATHERHYRVFRQEGVRCTDCHAFNAHVDIDDEAKALNVSRGVLFGVGRYSCHLCHNNPAAPIKMPEYSKQCRLCHTESQPKPADHTAGWDERHGIRAKFQAVSCTSCHRSSECQTCHSPSSMNFPTRRVHKNGNYRYTHAIEARINPRKCSTCHSTNYCLRCHKRGY